MHIFHSISGDLQQVQHTIQKHFKIRAGNINEFVKQDTNYLDINLRPAIVILFNRLFGPVTRQTIALGAVLQFIYMASRVHIKLSESGTAKDKPTDIRTAYQFPVLVGDYLYGKFFTTLCEGGIVHYLGQLGELICSINKNGILNLNNPGIEFSDNRQYKEIVRGESAEFFACCAHLGADLGGADKSAKQQIYNFGLNLGMAYALLERGAHVEDVMQYIQIADSILDSFPAGSEKECFKHLISMLAQENSVVQRMVV